MLSFLLRFLFTFLSLKCKLVYLKFLKMSETVNNSAIISCVAACCTEKFRLIRVVYYYFGTILLQKTCASNKQRRDIESDKTNINCKLYSAV